MSTKSMVIASLAVVAILQAVVSRFPFSIMIPALGTEMLVVSLFMILLVLIQRGRGGGLAGAFGGMGGQSAFGTRAGDTFTLITIILAVFWVLLAGQMGMAVRSNHRATAAGANTRFNETPAARDAAKKAADDVEAAKKALDVKVEEKTDAKAEVDVKEEPAAEPKADEKKSEGDAAAKIDAPAEAPKVDAPKTEEPTPAEKTEEPAAPAEGAAPATPSETPAEGPKPPAEAPAEAPAAPAAEQPAPAEPKP